MANLIERYIYDVVQRLPEKDREEVRRELNANICDMLPDPASEEEVRDVLNSLGAPAELAGQYSSKPKYLISPNVYDDYIRVLKKLLPLVGCICLVVGAVVGAIEMVDGGLIPLVDVIVNAITNGLSAGISGAFNVLFWVTVGFVIVERTGAKKATDRDRWTVDKLPDTIPNDKAKIPLSDSIAALVAVIIGSIFLLWFCLNRHPFVFTFGLSNDEITATSIFSESFLDACIPVIIIGTLLNIAECVVKIVRRRWTPLVCVTIVVSDIVCIGLMIYLLSLPQIAGPGLAEFVDEQGLSVLDSLFTTEAFAGLNLGLVIFGTIVVVCSVAECINAIYRTVQARRWDTQNKA